MATTWRPSLAEQPLNPFRREDYVPPFRPYELTNLMLDLILLARYLLVPKGRLVFFLPTVTEEYEAIDIPVVDGMRELKVGEGSVENFGKWGRRVSCAFSPCAGPSAVSQEMRLFC
jgi:tRNA (guanine10-N2)-methyltransferase